MYDLLLKGGTVIDPAHKLHQEMDLGITAGKVATLETEIAANRAKKVINATGLLVTPGVIDFHCHVGDGLYPNAIAPDDAGVLAGVTTVCDGGTAGYANLPIFKKFIIPRSRTDVFCFINLGSTGLAIMPEIWSWRNIDTDEILKTIEKNRDFIKGVKIRANGSVVDNLGMEAIRLAKTLSRDAGLPLMVHVGIDPHDHTPEDRMNAFTREMLGVLDRGDIVNHIYTWKSGGVIRPDGSPLPEFNEAVQRGVYLDTATGRTQWDSEIARKAIMKGLIPTTITTDLNMTTMQGIVYNAIGTMSKFMALGLTLNQVVEMTTINPARLLREEHQRGSLAPGMPADISVLEPREGEFNFNDGAQGHKFKGKLLLVPRLTIKNGVEIPPGPRIADMVKEFTAAS